MSPSAKKRPQNGVVFKVRLGTGSRRVLTKSLITPWQVEGKGALRGEGKSGVGMVSLVLPPNRGDKTLSLGLVKSC